MGGLVGVRCVRGYIGMQEHIRCQREEIGPPCSISPTILNLMTRPQPERADIAFSPSSLGACHRRTALTKKHDWYLDVASGYKMVRGSIIHEGLAHEPPPYGTLGVVRELKMQAPIKVNGEEQIFHGTFDELTLLRVQNVEVATKVDEASGDTLESHWENQLHVKLLDYKSVSEVGHDLVEPRREHTYQVNSYAWLVTQFLPDYLNRCTGWGGEYSDPCGKLYLSTNNFPHIDSVVVDELSIQYMDMKKTRTFTSLGFGTAQGKMKGDMVSGHWRRRKPIEYEELELSPVHQFSSSFIESKIRSGIEAQIEAETLLAPPLEGDRANMMCRSCPVLEQCIETGLLEGYSMADQMPFREK